MSTSRRNVTMESNKKVRKSRVCCEQKWDVIFFLLFTAEEEVKKVSWEILIVFLKLRLEWRKWVSPNATSAPKTWEFRIKSTVVPICALRLHHFHSLIQNVIRTSDGDRCTEINKCERTQGSDVRRDGIHSTQEKQQLQTKKFTLHFQVNKKARGRIQQAEKYVFSVQKKQSTWNFKRSPSPAPQSSLSSLISTMQAWI